MNFAIKLQEQLCAAEADPQEAAGQARALLTQFATWPVSTQIPLTRVAQLIAGLSVETPANVRRIVATDCVELADAA